MWSTNKVVVVPEAKDLVVTLEKPTISSISVSARMRVIDAFSQMKREYKTILDDADPADPVPSPSFTLCSPGNFLKVLTNNEILTAKRHRSQL